MKLSDITPELVKAAYEKTGLRPIRKAWLSDGCACAVSVVAIAELGADAKDIEAEVFPASSFARSFGVEASQMYSFVEGFDGSPSDNPHPKAYPAEYQQGRAVASLIFGEEANA